MLAVELPSDELWSLLGHRQCRLHMRGNFILCMFSALSEAQAAELAQEGITRVVSVFSADMYTASPLFLQALYAHHRCQRTLSVLSHNRGLRSLCSPDAFFTFRKLPSYLFVCHSLICYFIGSLIFIDSLIHFLLLQIQFKL